MQRMLTENITAEEWLKLVGREKLQTFQDLFVKKLGASMAFFDLDGKLLTVWSRYSLFCRSLQTQGSSRCEAVTERVLQAVKSGRTRIIICPFGITCIYCPVKFKGSTIAYAYLGGIIYPDSMLSEMLRVKYHLPVVEKNTVEDLARLLEASLNLLDINAEAINSTSLSLPPSAAPDSMRDKRISKREWDIIELICHGFSNKQIASSLYISETTVKTHVSNILAKLDLHDRMQIIVHYYSRFSAITAINS